MTKILRLNTFPQFGRHKYDTKAEHKLAPVKGTHHTEFKVSSRHFNRDGQVIAKRSGQWDHHSPLKYKRRSKRPLSSYLLEFYFAQALAVSSQLVKMIDQKRS